MNDAQSCLNEIWNRFRREGIADDLDIIERIAAVLTSEPPDWTLPPVRNLQDPVELRWLHEVLGIAAESAGGKALLFDRHVLFRLSSMLPGGRYPTPRHIVKLMYSLVGAKPEHSLADFACGSGGFLVNRPVSKERVTGRTVGCEISPNWARIAEANAQLHGLSENVHIEVGNSLTRFSTHGPGEDESSLFDLVMMNPPFGEAVDPQLAADLPGIRVGSRSETILTGLALRQMKDQGCAALLVPSGVVYGAGVAEYGLRKNCVESHFLEAVLALPKDSFQPFSTLRTHLLIVRKAKPRKGALCWLYQIERDGYPPGRARDLTRPPQRQSDFELVPPVFTRSSAKSIVSLPKAKPIIRVRPIRGHEKSPAGFVVSGLGDTIISTVESHPETKVGPFYTVGVTVVETQPLVWFRINQRTGVVEQVADLASDLRSLYGVRKTDPVPRGTPLISGSSEGRGVVLTEDGRLIGIGVSYEALRASDYDLQFGRYARSHEDLAQAELGDPVALLDSLRTRHRAFAGIVESLRTKLAGPPIAEHVSPPEALDFVSAAVQYDHLSPQQGLVYNWVISKLEATQTADRAYNVAQYFTLAEIELANPEVPGSVIRSTIDLLLRMGQIVPVTIALPSTGASLLAYRLATRRDVWDPSPMESSP